MARTALAGGRGHYEAGMKGKVLVSAAKNKNCPESSASPANDATENTVQKSRRKSRQNQRRKGRFTPPVFRQLQHMAWDEAHSKGHADSIESKHVDLAPQR